MKRIRQILFVLGVLFFMFPATTGYAKANDTVAWTFEESTGKLEFYGTGVIDREDSWHQYYKQIKTVVIGKGITEIGWNAFKGCGQLEKVTMADTVTELGPYAFYDCVNLKEITLSKNIKRIYQYTFTNCKRLKSIVLPKNAISISEYVFDGCDKLASITLPEKLRTINIHAFYRSKGIKSFKLASKNKYFVVKDGVIFSKDGKTLIAYPVKKAASSYKVPDQVTTIHDLAFYECTTLKNITLSKNLKKIKQSAFGGCINLKSITLPEKVTSVYYTAFWNCDSLTSVKVSSKNKAYMSKDGVLFTKDGKTLLCYPANKTGASYKIPDQVTVIGKGGFYGAKKLKTITASKNLKAIDQYAFSRAGKLKTVTFRSKAPNFRYGSLDQTYKKTVIRVPAKYYKGYKEEIQKRAFPGTIQTY